MSHASRPLFTPSCPLFTQPPLLFTRVCFREEEKYRRGRASSTLGNTQTLQELEEVVRYSTECSVLEEVGVGLASILDSRETLSRFNSRVLNFVALGKDTSSDLYVLPENIPRRVYDRVTGRLFPRALRLHLYDKHLKSEKNGSGNRSKGSEEVDYSTLVMNAAADKGITDPRRTNVNNLLSHTVNVAFSETGEDFKESGQWMKDRALAVLNMYYTLTGKNSVQMSYVLVPFLSLHDRGEVGDDTFEFKVRAYGKAPASNALAENSPCSRSLQTYTFTYTRFARKDSPLLGHVHREGHEQAERGGCGGGGGAFEHARSEAVQAFGGHVCQPRGGGGE